MKKKGKSFVEFYRRYIKEVYKQKTKAKVYFHSLFLLFVYDRPLRERENINQKLVSNTDWQRICVESLNYKFYSSLFTLSWFFKSGCFNVLFICLQRQHYLKKKS